MNKKLQEIYDRLPVIECQGKCYQSCGPIGMMAAEVENIQAHGHQAPKAQAHIIHGALTCTALKRKRCQIYDARPLICRLFGVAEGLECPFGCKPNQLITRQAAADFLAEVQAIKAGSVLTIELGGTHGAVITKDS